MAEIIFMTGARGGAGVTTCAVKLAAALSAEGERTLVIDGDSYCASGLEACGMQALSVYTLADVEEGACRVKQAILNHPSSPNFYILPSLGCKSPTTAERAVNECGQMFDYVICDNCTRAVCKRAIVVSDPYSSSLAAAKKRGEILKDCGFNDVGLIVNKVNGGLVFDGLVLTPAEFASVARLNLCGVIPEDLFLPLGRIKPCTKKAFALTANYVSGKSRKTYGVIRSYSGIKGFIKRRMREII